MSYERDYANEWDEWLRETGGDGGSGGTIPTEYEPEPTPQPSPAPTAAPAPTGGGRPPKPSSAPDGYEWVDAFDGGWELVRISDGNSWDGRNGGGSGGGGVTFTGGPQLRSLSEYWPGYNPPQWTDIPTFEAPAPFSYEDFVAPTLQEAESEPGYEFASTQGRKHVEASKAAQGVYKSGQTLKDIYSWASEYAKQNYGGSFDRKLQVYGTNRNNAADNYMTNYGVSRDVFDRKYGASRDLFDRNFNSYQGGYDSQKRYAELMFARDWDQYAKDIDIKTTLYNGGNE